MSLWARVKDGKVEEIGSLNPEHYAEPEIWVRVPVDLEPFVDTTYVLTEDLEIAPPTLDYLKDQLKKKLAERRWYKIETGGIEHESLWFGTKDVDTTNINKTIMLGNVYEQQRAIKAAEVPPVVLPPFSSPWKALNGFAELSLEEVITIGMSCGQYITQCFREEGAGTTAIEAESSIEDVLEAYYMSIDEDRPDEIAEEIPPAGEEGEDDTPVFPDAEDMEAIAVPNGTIVVSVEPATVSDNPAPLEETPYIED